MKPKTRFSPLVPFIAAAIAGLPVGAGGAPITWGAATTIAGDTDVATAGTTVFAYNWAGATQSINGVPFTPPGNGVTLGGLGGLHPTAFGSGSAPFASLSAAYRAVLIGSGYSGNTPGTVTLNNLIPGRQYQVQLWANDSRNLNLGFARTETVTSSGGNTVTLSYPGNLDGAVGQYTIGIFTADATSQVINLLGNSATQVNALQLRDLTPPANIGFWNGLGGAGWDQSATASWCLNPYNEALSSGTFAAAMTLSSGQAWFDDSYYSNGAKVAVTQTQVNIAAGGVSADVVGFLANTLNYTLASADATGLTGATILTKRGSGSLTLTGANTHTGGSTLLGGILNLGHASALGGGPLVVAGGTLDNTSGGPLTLAGDNAQQWAGNLTFAGSNDLNLGSGAVALEVSPTVNTIAGNLTVGGPINAGTRNLTKTGTGTLTLAGTASLNNLDIQNGAVVLDGGGFTSNSPNGGWGLWLRGATSSLTVRNDATVSVLNGFQVQQGTATIESGSLSAVGTGMSEIYLGNSTNAATLNIKGGSVTARVMSFGNSGSNATLNLEGGTLTWNNAPTKSSGPATLNMGGGTLRAGGTFTVPTSLPFVLTGINGALTVDTQANNPTFANALTGSGGLVKTGPGTLTLAAPNSHTGATTAAEGTLSLTGSLAAGPVIAAGGTFALTWAGLADLSDLTIKDGGTLRVETGGMTVKSVTVENGAVLELPADGGTTTVTGALTLTGSPAFTVKPDFGGPPVQGSYDLLTPGSVAGTSGPIATDLGIYQGTRTYGGVTTITGGKLVLNVTVGSPPASLVWNNGAGTGNWSINTAADKNFRNGAVNDVFFNQDAVTFDGAGAGPVNLVGTLIPASVDVTSSSGDYTFTGSGSISGLVTLTKAGTSTLTIETANTSTGETYLNGGTLVVGHPGALGSAGLITFGGGTLKYGTGIAVDFSSRFSAAADQPYSVDTNGQNVTWAAALNSFGGTLVKAGEGTLKLTSPPAYGGATVINGGTLELSGNVVTYGGGAIQINHGATLAFSGGRYDVNGATITFGSTGGGTLTATSDAFGGFVQFTAGNTLVTTGGARNHFTGVGYNLNTHIAVFDIAIGSDDTSDLQVTTPLGNVGGITKTGAGRLELAAVNLYGGPTSVTGGKLLVTGSLTGGGGIAVAAGATFELGSTGAMTFVPKANGVVNSLGGDGIATLSGTIDVSLAQADPTPGNSWLLVDTNTLAETFGPDFKVAGFLETTSGSGIWTKTDGAGTWTFAEAGGTLTLTAGYASWIASFFPGVTDPAIIGPDADPDHDGVDNGIEFLTGSVPSDHLSHKAPTTVRNGSGDLVVSFERVDAAEAYPVVVEYGTDLQGWSIIPVPTAAISGPPVTVVDNGTDPDAITVVVPAAGDPRKFARVGIAIPSIP